MPLREEHGPRTGFAVGQPDKGRPYRDRRFTGAGGQRPAMRHVRADSFPDKLLILLCHKRLVSPRGARCSSRSVSMLFSEGGAIL